MSFENKGRSKREHDRFVDNGDGTNSVYVTSHPDSPLNISGLIDFQYDYIEPSFNSSSDVWEYRLGGSGGSLQATITITYTDSTKQTIQSVAKV